MKAYVSVGDVWLRFPSFKYLLAKVALNALQRSRTYENVFFFTVSVVGTSHTSYVTQQIEELVFFKGRVIHFLAPENYPSMYVH